MKIVTKEQRTPEWVRARMGVPSASQFSRVITPVTGKLSSQAEEYAFELAAERYALYLPERAEYMGMSPAMRQGLEIEPEARRWYAFQQGVQVEQVGFCTTDDGRFGCSPDGLVGPDGLLELKCPLPRTHVSYLAAGALPAEYKPQVHGQLFVTGRAWVDFLSYCPGLPPFLVRVEPGEYTAKLAAALEAFWLRLGEVVRMVESMRDPHQVGGTYEREKRQGGALRLRDDGAGGGAADQVPEVAGDGKSTRPGGGGGRRDREENPPDCG